MDKYLDRLPIPTSLIRLFTSNLSPESRNSDHHKSNQNLDASFIIAETLIAVIQNTQRLFKADDKFNSIKELAKDVEDISEVNHVLLELSTLIADLSEDFASDKLEEIYAIPGDIIEHYKFPEAYTEKSYELKSRCKNICSISEYKITVQNIFNLIEDIYKDSTVQKKELESFLLNVGFQISRIGEELHNFIGAQSSDFKLQSDLNIQMHDAVSSLSEDLLQADDLDILKDTVKVQLDTLQNLVKEERQVVKKHELSIKENMNFLASKVNKLKLEAQVLKEKVKIEKENALRDPLTGLFNREAYNKTIEALMDEAINSNTSLSLLVWDIDHFKKFNDKYGHVIGDKVLKAVTKKLANTLKENYFLARYGGEEFVMLLPNLNAAETMQYADSIREEVSRITYLFKGKPLKVTISCGIAVMHGENYAKNLFERADKALYEAKVNGRNCVKLEEDLYSA